MALRTKKIATPPPARNTGSTGRKTRASSPAGVLLDVAESWGGSGQGLYQVAMLDGELLEPLRCRFLGSDCFFRPAPWGALPVALLARQWSELLRNGPRPVQLTIADVLNRRRPPAVDAVEVCAFCDRRALMRVRDQPRCARHLSGAFGALDPDSQRQARARGHR